MDKRKLFIACALGAFVVAIGSFFYVVKVSKAFSYLDSDPKACINCHVMNSYYASWEHSAHREAAKCVDCHLPHSGFEKYAAKARDGFNHASAFTFGTFDQAIKIGEDGAKRVQANCVTCHASLASAVLKDSDLNHRFGEEALNGDRFCWSCHRETPHGTLRSVTVSPNNLGVRYVK
jgi:cytochrome c nitrite reductase small subunit